MKLLWLSFLFLDDRNFCFVFWISTNLSQFIYVWLTIFFSALHMEESVADKITSSCSKIKSAVLRITDYHSCVHNDSISGKNRFDFSPILQCILLIFINYGFFYSNIFALIHLVHWTKKKQQKNKLSTNFNTLLIIARQINTFHYLDKVPF